MHLYYECKSTSVSFEADLAIESSTVIKDALIIEVSSHTFINEGPFQEDMPFFENIGSKFPKLRRLEITIIFEIIMFNCKPTKIMIIIWYIRYQNCQKKDFNDD